MWNAGVLRSSSATRSPGCTPSACSPPAMGAETTLGARWASTRSLRIGRALANQPAVGQVVRASDGVEALRTLLAS